MAESTNIAADTPAFDLARELEETLKIWAHAQSPDTDFETWRMCAFVAPVRVQSGLYFSPGELTLCRPAPEKAEEFLQQGLPPPLVAWSFARGRELLVNPALVTLETEPFEPLQLPSADELEAPAHHAA